MYKKHIKLEPIKKHPTMDHILACLQTAEKSRGSTVELFWKPEGAKLGYSLTVRVEIGGHQPVWSLYEQGEFSKNLWSQTFSTLDLLYEVIFLTAPQEDVKPEPTSVLSHGLEPSVLDSVSTGKQNVDEKLKDSQPNSLENNPNAPFPPNYQPTPYPQQPYPQQFYPPNYPQPPYSQPPYPQPPYPQPPYPPQFYPPNYPTPYYAPEPSQTQSGYNYVQPSSSSSNTFINNLDNDLIKKRPNILLGTFLVEASLVPEPTIEAALELQSMIKKAQITQAQAAIALRRFHEKGGHVDSHIPEDLSPLSQRKFQGPPLGQLLIDARIINLDTLNQALTLQEALRAGAIELKEACTVINRDFMKAKADNYAKKSKQVEEPQAYADAYKLLIQAGLFTDDKFNQAKIINFKKGGKLSNTIVQENFLDSLLLKVAVKCSEAISQDKLKIEQSIILLHYSQRARVDFDDAIKELGFDI